MPMRIPQVGRVHMTVRNKEFTGPDCVEKSNVMLVICRSFNNLCKMMEGIYMT